LNPTAAIAGLLHKWKLEHPWRDPATAFCWRKIDEQAEIGGYEVRSVLTFLEHVPAREPGFSALAPGTRHSAPGAFEGLPARYWAVMKFIHDEGELMWLNNTPENTLPLGFAGRARRNARPAFFLHRLPRSRSDHALAAYPFLPNKLASARFAYSLGRRPFADD